MLIAAGASPLPRDARTIGPRNDLFSFVDPVSAGAFFVCVDLSVVTCIVISQVEKHQSLLPARPRLLSRSRAA
jgi:hypothetical protein